MTTQVSRTPANFGQEGSTPKEEGVKARMSTLPIEILENIARFLPDAALKAFACTDSANRQVALKERVDRMLSTAHKELRQLSSLALVANASNQSPIGTYRSFLHQVAQHLPTEVVAVAALNQSLNAIVTDRLANEILSLKTDLFKGIDNKVVGWDEIDRSSQKLQEQLVAQALIEIISASPIPNDIRSMAVMKAAQDGHLEIVQALLASGASSQRDRGWAVTDAARNGHLEMVKALLANGSISEVHRGWAVSNAALLGHLEMVKALLANGSISERDRGWAVTNAAEEGHLEIVQALLASGSISLSQRFDAIKAALQNGNYRIVSELLPAKAIFMTAFLGLTASYINSLQYQEEK